MLLNASRRHGLWPRSAMQVVYVYQGMLLELYSLALLKARTEHLWTAAARAALTLSPAAARAWVGDANAMKASAKASNLRPFFMIVFPLKITSVYSTVG